MGLITGAASIIGVAGRVAGTVLKLGSNALSLGAKIIKNPIGKFAIGAGAVAVLASKFDNNNEDSLLGKAKAGISSLIESFKDMIGKGVATGAAHAAAAVDYSGTQEARESLEAMIASDTAAYENGAMPIATQVIPVGLEPGVSQDYEAAAPEPEASYPM